MSTENRAVLHIALRNRSNRPVLVDGKDVMPAVNDVLKRMAAFATGLRAGTISAAGGAKFTDVVNIGIGGSDLGPAMTTLALAPYHDGPRLHFVSNVDGAHIADTLKPLDPATTLFIVASKTFTTIETMTNAADGAALDRREAGRGGGGGAFRRDLDGARQGGRLRHRRRPHLRLLGLGRRALFDLVGHRPAADDRHRRRRHFGEFLDGAHAMDEHFRTAPFDSNLPVLLGLIGVWHRNVCGYPARAPSFPTTSGCRACRPICSSSTWNPTASASRATARGVAEPTGPVVWGEPGTNGQHAFFQLLHQGTDVIPVEFLIAARVP